VKTTTLFLTLLLIGSAFAASNALDAGELVIEQLLAGDTDAKRVYAHEADLNGGEMAFWHHSISFPNEPGHFVFIDDHPAANWEHAARAVYVTEAGQIHTWAVSTPPMDNVWIGITELTDGEFYDGVNVDYRIPTKEDMVRANPWFDQYIPAPGQRAGENYALLMSGGANAGNNHIRYWNDMAYIYYTLINVYSFDEDNIFVLMSDGDNSGNDRSDGTNSPTDLDGDGDQDYTDPCTHDKVIEYMNDLATTLTSQDSLFIFTTDHGGGSTSGGNDSYLNLWNNQQLRDDEFADELDDISFAQCIITMEQCFSGGFVDDVNAIDNVVISTAANANEYSYAMAPAYVYDTYAYFWTAAVAGNLPGWPHDMGGTAVDADTDNDGIVTAREAFVYAEAEDFSNEHPQYLDVSNIGESISLWGGGLDGPYVKLNSYTIDGDNGDALLDPGEAADISVTLENIGNANATNVVGNLSSSDADITVNTGTVNWGTIASGATAASPTDFRITVNTGAGNPERYSLDLNITGDDGINKNVSLSLTVGDQWGFVDDIESGENGWTHSGTGDQWHIETARFHGGANSWKCGGSGTSDHGNNMDCTLETPLVLVGSSSPTLGFWSWHELENGYDYCYLKFDGDTLDTFNGSATSWTERSYDLASYANTVGNFQFNFTSDASTVEEGFYFDDFNLQPVSGGSAVELVGFSVNGNEDGVLLNWKLDNPESAATFNLYRQDGVLVESMVIGNGNRDSGTPLNATPLAGGRSEYSFLDTNVADGGDYLYYLKATDVDGSGYLFGPVELHYTVEQDLALSLDNAYPNPTAGDVALSFSLAVDNQAVSLAVYDLSGRLVETILEDTLSTGRYTVHWDASANPAGVYFYRLSTNDESLTHRLVISR